jgi:predicted enzyme related to lactoylglutathione lyase
MSERNGYEPGVPMWVDTWREDARPAAEFYGALFGWELAGLDDEGPQRYVMGQVRGRDVAAIGSPLPPAAPHGPAAWTTYIWVEDADVTAAAIRDAGGTVVAEPFDSMDGGRMVIGADPAGAVFGAWAPGEHRGAEVVNEPSAWAMSFLQTPDPEGAKAFYAAVFGWQTEDFGPATMFRLPGFFGGEPSQPVPRDVVATMAPAEPEAGDTARWGVNFWVADIEAAAETTTRGGGRVLVEPAEIPGLAMKEAVIADPEGAVITVTELVGVPG